MLGHFCSAPSLLLVEARIRQSIDRSQPTDRNQPLQKSTGQRIGVLSAPEQALIGGKGGKVRRHPSERHFASLTRRAVLLKLTDRQQAAASASTSPKSFPQ